MMTHRLFLPLFVALLLPLSAMAQSAPIPLGEISRYFNAFRTAQGDFTQINADGTIATGRIMMHRPGRIRFEYDPPEASLVLAGGGQVAIFDPRGNDGPTTYPLRRTPLNLILAANVDLSRERMVVGHFSDAVTTTVVAQDPDHPEYGQIRLIFSAAPVELRQWVIVDDLGQETTIILGEMSFGGDLRASLFSIDIESNLRRPNR
jgi:outer membrane lipoprotein-sorting protein